MINFRVEIKTQLKNNYNQFQNTQDKATHQQIPSTKNSKKKIFKKRLNFFQQKRHQLQGKNTHILNFYNILCVNELAFNEINDHESYLKSLFYCQSLNKIEFAEKYLVLYLTNNYSPSSPVCETVERYLVQPNQSLNRLGEMLNLLEGKLKNLHNLESAQDFMNEQIQKILDSMEDFPYICKISNKKLIIAKSLINIFGCNCEQFAIQCLNYGMPLFEVFGTKSYKNVTLKQAHNLLLMMDLLQEKITLSTCNEMSSMIFNQIIHTKLNTDYVCRMKLSMPLPLVELISIEKVLQKCQNVKSWPVHFDNLDLKKYCFEIRQKQYQTLQYLINLQENMIPYDKSKVVGYCKKNESQGKKMDQQDLSKSYHTISSK